MGGRVRCALGPDRALGLARRAEEGAVATTYSCATAAARAEVRAAIARGEITRTPVSSVIICSLLDISQSEASSLYVFCPVDGYVGREVAKDIATRFGLSLDEPGLSLGAELAARGVLTEEEGRWLDDTE